MTTAATAAGISTAMLDRLTLTDKRIEGLADGITALIGLSDPLGGGGTGHRAAG